jgi:hypothetical protein
VSPLYVPVTVKMPDLLGVIGQLPVPPDSVIVQLSVPPPSPSETLTVPVGVPAAGATAVTVAVTVTACPNTDGFGALCTTVFEPALFTVCEVVPELPVKFVSPL